MGLASALSTALTGLTAAETTIDVVGNNLANANTVGFKSSQAAFATQFLQTKSLGSAPSGNSGGTNPRQIGLGTMVADVTPNFTQGTIQISSNATDLAIQGDGFFIVQGTNGSQLYTRNGIFKLNSESQLTTITGNLLLGFGVDENYQIQTTTLVPLAIPLGAAAVAKATTVVDLQGTLSPSGALATSAQDIQTSVLGDSEWTYPANAASIVSAEAATTVGLGFTPAATGGSVDTGSYYYKIVYADSPYGSANATEGGASSATAQATVAAGQDTVQFNNLQSDERYGYVRVYRTAVGAGPDSTYFYVGETQSGYFGLSDSSGQGMTTAGGAMDAGEYHYRIEYATAPYPGGSAGAVSNTGTAIDVTVAAGQNSVRLDHLPTDPSYQYIRVYRTDKNASADSSYYYAGEIDTSSSTSFTDTVNDVGLGATLSHSVAFSDVTSDAAAQTHSTLDTASTISGNYSYYVTLYNTATGRESRPSPLSTAVTVEPGRIHLYDLPEADPAQWNQVRIYRNTATDNSTFYRVASIDDVTGNATYTDSIADSVIRNNPQIDLDGPKITESTLLKDVIRRDGSTYERVFDFPDGTTATLNFAGSKGGRTLDTKSLTVSDTTTVLDLMNFMQQALGVQGRPGPDPSNPIPIDANTGRAPGGYVQDGHILMVGNNGTANAIDIGLSAMQLVGNNGTSTINLPFSVTAQATGESAVTDFIAYDSLGDPIRVRLTAVLESRDSTSTTYRWFADSPDNDLNSGVNIAVGTGLISFDGEGNFTTATNSRVSIGREHISAVSPLEFQFDFSGLSGLAADESSLAVSRQDGSAPGVLSSFIVGEDGLIRGVFSNGITRDLGQIRLARFSNPAGLEQRGQNLFATGVNSGLPVEGNPNQQGIGSIVAGAQELSNTDVGGNLIELILASTMYRGNTRVVTTVQQMLDELLSLGR